MPDESTPQIDQQSEVSQVRAAQTEHSEQNSNDGSPSASSSEVRPNDIDVSPMVPLPAAAQRPANLNTRSYRLSAGWLSFTFYMLAYPAGSNLYTFFDWIKSHNAGEGLLESWKAGVLIVEEGYPTPEATLGATVFKICTSVVIYTPILILFYAYRVLYADFHAEDEDTLAPPEHGLLGESVRASGFGWISSFMALIFGKPRRRNPATFILKEVFAVCLIGNAFPIVFLLMFALLTAVRRELPATTEIRELPIATPFNFSITQSACRPYDLSSYVTDKHGLPDREWLNLNKPCGLASLSPDFVPLDEAERLASNMSTTFNITTLADAADLSVLVRRAINTTTSATVTSAPTKFRMQTFGARAVCTPDARFYASVMDERFVTVRRGTGDHGLRWPQRMSSRACVDNPTACPSVTVEALRDAPWRLMHYPLHAAAAAPGPFELGLKFLWPLYDSDSDSDSDSEGLWTAAHASCRVSYYNVTLEHISGTGRYTLVAESPAARFLTDGFSRHLRFGMIGGFLEDDVLPAFFSPSASTSTRGAQADAGRLAFLNQEVSRLAIASAGVFATGTGPTLEQSSVLRRVLAQYPVRAVLVFLVLAAAYAVFAFVLCLAFSLRRRSDPQLVAEGPGQAPPPTTASAAANGTAQASSTTHVEKIVNDRELISSKPVSAEPVEVQQFRISIRKFLFPLLTTGIAVLSIFPLLVWAFASGVKVAADNNVSVVANILMFLSILSSPILLYFYGRRVSELYLRPQASGAVAAPRDGLLVEALRVVGLSFLLSKSLKDKTSRLEPRNDIMVLKEALFVFMGVFSTIFLITITSIAISLKHNANSVSGLGSDADAGGRGVVPDDVLPVDSDKVDRIQPHVAFPFWPSSILVVLSTVYAIQILLICLAQSLVPIPRPATAPTASVRGGAGSKAEGPLQTSRE